MDAKPRDVCHPSVAQSNMERPKDQSAGAEVDGVDDVLGTNKGAKNVDSEGNVPNGSQPDGDIDFAYGCELDVCDRTNNGKNESAKPEKHNRPRSVG